MKKLRLIFISCLILLIVFNVSQESQSCGADDWYIDYPAEYSLFSPIPEDIQKYATLGFRFYRQPSHQLFYQNSYQKNIQAWQGYFVQNFSEQDINAVIYKTQTEEIFDIVQFVESKSHALSEKLQHNELVKYLKNNPTKGKEFLDYLVFAKLCEPSATQGDYTWFNTENAEMKTLDYQAIGSENFYEIAQKFNVNPEDLAHQNNYSSKDIFDYKVQGNLKVSVAELTYTTSQEENIHEIEEKFGLSYGFPEHLQYINTWTSADLDHILVTEQIPNFNKNWTLPIENYLQAGITLNIHKSIQEAKAQDKIVIHEYIERNKYGTSLSSIAFDYGVNLEDLKKWNQLDNTSYDSNNTTYKQKLIIKTAKYTHQVKAGERLEDIAQQYHISDPNQLEFIIRVWNPKPQKIIKPSPVLISKKLSTQSTFKKGISMKIYLDPKFVGKQNLIEKGMEDAQKAKTDFMRARYAYQAIRLARYAGQYQETVELYDKLIAPIQNKPMICYWALEQVAGALGSLGKNVASNYAFAQVFFNEPSRAKTAFYGFKVRNDQEWKDLLKLCKTKEEKTSLHLLRALSWDADILTELENIYAIDPNSKHLELLSVKLINTLEFDLLGAELEKENVLFVEDYKGFPKEESYETLQALNQWLEKVIVENKVQNRDFWQLSNAYIQYLNKKPKEAKNTFQGLAKNSQNTVIAQQAKVFSLMLEISELKTITPEIENQIFARVQEFEPKVKQEKKYRRPKTPEEYLYYKLSNFMTQVFALHYDQTKNKGKIALCNPKFTTYEEKIAPDLARTEGMITLLEKKDKTDFEQFLLQKIDTNIAQQQVFLYEMKGTILLQQNKVQKALEALKEVPNSSTNLRQTTYNPLAEKQYLPTQKLWNKKTIAEKILALEKLTKKQNKQSIEHFITLGNIYYNLSHHGNMWWATDYYWSSAGEVADSYHIWVGYTYIKTRDNVDLSLAKRYYKQALEISKKYKNDNLASKALFLLIKCEAQPRKPSTYYYKDEAYKEAEKKYQETVVNYQNYVTELQNNYKNTAYYQSVIKECGMID